MLSVVVLPSNRPADRFYRGGRRITDFRGEPPAGPHEPEDWVASTTTVAGERAVGLSTLPDGRLLAEAIASDPEGWLGDEHVRHYGADTRLLVKLLDAGQRLPVHAHPDAAFAAHHLGRAHGKAEAWCILRGGIVHLGLRRDVARFELIGLVERQDVESLLGLLHPIAVDAGDVVFVPPGMLHAIDEGVFMVELQEPEDLSILLEWRGFAIDGRVDGHLGLGFDLALDAVETRGRSIAEIRSLVIAPDSRRANLPPEAGSYFRLERHVVDGELELDAGFCVLVVIAGQVCAGEVPSIELPLGSTAVVPFAAGSVCIAGCGELLVCRPPSP